MDTKENPKSTDMANRGIDLHQPFKHDDILFVSILTALVLCIGLYRISTTVLIANDGVLYIEIAKKIADDPLKAVHETGQAPGYPFLIYLMHKAIGLFYNAQPLQGWIISAQAISLFSKLIAAIALYFVGSYFVGSRFSFWGVLILSILPDSVDYGSDALTDWSNIMFLAIGFLLLLLGVQYRKRWIFGYAGIAAGLGYLTRPECGQVVLYGSVWLLFNLIRPQGKMKRTKAAGALVLLLGGFAVIAVPYMLSKGYVFPEQHIWKFPALLSMSNDTMDSALNINMCLAGLPVGKIIGNQTLITSLCETLMYYFIPALLIGSHTYFRKQPKKAEQTFFAAAFIIVNVAIMVLWQQLYKHPLSRRYMLPLVAFTVFYIPIGLHEIACWLNRKTTRGSEAAEDNIRHWFFILMVAGIGLCAVKLGMVPLRGEKQGYRDTAEWLNKNTNPADIIAVQDSRISFYAERQGVEYYSDSQIPERAGYIVKIIRHGDEKPKFGNNAKEEYSTWVDGRKKDKELIVYRVNR
jgi:4-amino-4-deoxy-L-arabinose transferase-like glycosyltransferase